MFFERMGIIPEDLAEIGTLKSDHVANLHTLQRLTFRVDVDETILHYRKGLSRRSP